jgi:hypothetical protein
MPCGHPSPFGRGGSSPPALINAILTQPITAAMSLSPSPLAPARANALAAPSIMPAGAPSDWASAAA